MRRMLPLLFLQCIATVALAGDIKPADPSTPLLKFYEPKFTSLGSATQRPEAELVLPPLLTVWSVRDLILARDGKGVMLGLTESDTKKFAELTRRFDKRYLIVAATDEIMEVLHITAPIEDGCVGFKHPAKAPIAEYLRRRFHIAEFK
jgi:hypothetical protein